MAVVAPTTVLGPTTLLGGTSSGSTTTGGSGVKFGRPKAPKKRKIGVAP